MDLIETENLQLVSSSDIILKTKLSPFDFSDPPFSPIEYAHKLVRCMLTHNAIGLASNQVGIPYRIFSMRGEPSHFCCFNPKVVWESEQTVLLEESCVSFPGLIVKIKRPEFIRVRFNTPNGEIITKQFVGMTARCFLHEMDHLEGKLFFDRANRYYRELAFKKWKRIKI